MKQVLEAYENAYAYVMTELSSKATIEYLELNSLEFGICYYCKVNHIDFLCGGHWYITDIPYTLYQKLRFYKIESLEFKTKVLYSISFRIDYLKTLIYEKGN